MEKPLFSVVGIMRNEEKTLPRLLKSLEEFKNRGGEVVITDTGSTDGSVKMARDWGCKVTEVGEIYRHTIDKELAKDINEKFVVEGEDDLVKEGDKYFDFASARNKSASMAENNWVCTVDMDEELTHFDIDKINELIKTRPDLESFEYKFIFAHDQWGRPNIMFTQSKFYDKTRMEWRGIVHEMLSSTGNHGGRFYLPNDVFLLEHFQNHESNRHSYLIGLSVDCFLHPDNDRNSHYAAREFMWAGKPKTAIKEFERHIAMNRWPAERAQSMIFKGDCLLGLGKPDEAKRCWLDAFEVEPKRREPLMRLAWQAFRSGDKQKTICYATAALQIPRNDFYSNYQPYYQDEPHALLYWAYGWIGNIPAAQEHMLKALDYCPYNPKYLSDTKFYFEYPDNGIQGWMRFPELQFLYNTAKTMNTILEIGSWKGKSTHALLSGCKKGFVTAVDTFAGSDDVKDATNDIAKKEDIYQQFKDNTKDFQNLITFKGTSAEFNKAKKEKYDMIFIDALHTKQGVMDDIKFWKDRAKVMLCGHDYSSAWPAVMEGVNEALGGPPDEVHDSIWVKWIK